MPAYHLLPNSRDKKNTFVVANIKHQPIVAPTNYHYKKVIPKQNILNLISNKIKVQYCVFNLVKIFVKEFYYLEKWKHTCQCMSFIMKPLSCTSIVNFSINTLIYPDMAHCGILYIKRNRFITSFVARYIVFTLEMMLLLYSYYICSCCSRYTLSCRIDGVDRSNVV